MREGAGGCESIGESAGGVGSWERVQLCVGAWERVRVCVGAWERVPVDVWALRDCCWMEEGAVWCSIEAWERVSLGVEHGRGVLVICRQTTTLSHSATSLDFCLAASLRSLRLPSQEPETKVFEIKVAVGWIVGFKETGEGGRRDRAQCKAGGKLGTCISVTTFLSTFSVFSKVSSH